MFTHYVRYIRLYLLILHTFILIKFILIKLILGYNILHYKRALKTHYFNLAFPHVTIFIRC